VFRDHATGQVWHGHSGAADHYRQWWSTFDVAVERRRGQSSFWAADGTYVVAVLAAGGYAVERVGIAEQNDMAIQQGNAVFILGYPLGFSHFIDTPIWKSGCIASEPHLETVEETAIGGGRVIIDATTRLGMSGAPVIMREKTHYLTENGEIIQHANATRWIGIYASRPNILIGPALSDEDRRPEIGYFYKSGAVQKTITDGIRGPNFGELP
jgi:hypothetical protein